MIKIFIVALLLVYYGSFLTHKTDLVTADLGRHLKNGEMLFAGNFEILRTNFYSYTEPSFPTLNHHWGSGAILFAFHKIGGFIAVHLFFILVSLGAFLLFFSIAKSEAGLGPATLIAIPIIPLLGERTEIRPEIFSYFLAGLFFWVLWNVQKNRISKKWLFCLPFLEILWVNLHIYFFLGPVIVLAFLLGKFEKRLLAIFLLSGLAALINPFGIKGALAPLEIFREYGYRVAENQPVWFIEKIIRNPNFFIFKIVFVILFLSFIYTRFKMRGSGTILLLGLGFSLMAWLQIRNFAMFGLFALPLIAFNFSSERSDRYQKLSLALLLVIFVIIISGNLNHRFPYWREFGLGLEKGNSQAAEFWKAHNAQGPIFNNYDIGSYLIYHLFPRERVFVDNRPEAYPAKFFQEIYIPMQESEKEFLATDKKFNFNAVVFSHRDLTPWGQTFLTRKIQDPAWAPVFTDDEVIILLRRDELNQKIIEQNEIKHYRSGL